MLSRLNAIKFKANWRVLLALLITAYLVNTMASIIAESVELTDWARALVLMVEDVSFVALSILGLVALGALALAVIKVVAGLFPSLFEFGNADDNQTEVIAEAESVTYTLDALGGRLAEIESNRDQAIRKLQDADVLASTLVGLIRRTVAKANSLTSECGLMQAALDAFVSGDPVRIAQAAGQLNDEHIRNLLLETKGDDSYRASLLNLIATQTGALRSSSDALRELSTTWIEGLARYRAQTARLSVVVDALDAARPIASIDASLRVAQSYLMMQGKSELHQVTRTLPAGAVRPMIEGYK
jgi:hypothetical protein